MPAFGPSCPWYDALQAHGPANVKWCEERVCAWINEPANAWSNLGYMAAGLWILSDSRRRGSGAGKAFGAAVFVMGAFSFYYHATNNFLTQSFDFLGMYLMAFFIVAVNARRLGWPRRGLELLYLGACVAATLALWPLDASGFPIQWTVAITGAVILAAELAARSREKSPPPMTLFWTALATLVVGELFSLSDLKRVWCDPKNHWLQGHAVWHWFGGAAMPQIYLYYRERFDRAWARL